VADADLSGSRFTNANVLKTKDLGPARFVKFNDFRHVDSTSVSNITVRLRLASPDFTLDLAKERINMVAQLVRLQKICHRRLENAACGLSRVAVML
jgi:hypothetical protein